MTKDEYAKTMVKTFGHLPGKLYVLDLDSEPLTKSTIGFDAGDTVMDAKGRVAYVCKRNGLWSDAVAIPHRDTAYSPNVKPFADW